TRGARRTREIVVRSAIVGAAASAAPRPLTAAVATTTCLLRDALHPLHVLSQRFGNHHAAVALLIVLENGHERATEGKSGAVDRVDESRFLFRCPITNVRATRLKVGEVRARRNLAIRLLSWQPHLEVVCLRWG